MTWTQEKPNRAGFWWWRESDSSGPVVLEVRRFDAGLFAGFHVLVNRVDKFGGSWSTEPVEPPKESE